VGADQCSISAFSIDPNAASVTPVNGSPFHLPPSCRQSGPFSFLLRPSGTGGYLTDGDGGIFPLQWLTLDATTGAVTGGGEASAAMASAASAAAIDPSGKFLYLAGPGPNGSQDVVYEYSVDATSGVLTSIGNVATGAASPVTIAPAGKFVYVATTTSIYAYSIDPSSGALTPVSGSPFTVASSSDTISALIAIDPSGRFAYVPSAGSNAVYAMSIDAATG